MRGISGLLMAGGMLLGSTAMTEAQVTFSLGNPYTGGRPSITIGQPAQNYYAQPGYAQPGYAQPGYAQSGYPQSGYAQSGYAQPNYAQPGYPHHGYTQPGYNQPTFNRQDYAQPSYANPYANAPTTYYNSGYRGYSSGPSPYERGYHGSTYVNPSGHYPGAIPYGNVGSPTIYRYVR